MIEYQITTETIRAAIITLDPSWFNELYLLLNPAKTATELASAFIIFVAILAPVRSLTVAMTIRAFYLYESRQCFSSLTRASISASITSFGPPRTLKPLATLASTARSTARD